MNEAETRAELIDPKLKECGWSLIEGSKILREYHITKGKIQVGGARAKPNIADYILIYNGRKLAVIEAKSDEQNVGQGVAQAKEYALKLNLDYTYSSNGNEIYEINMKTGKERLVDFFPTPDELWNNIFSVQNHWRDKFSSNGRVPTNRSIFFTIFQMFRCGNNGEPYFGEYPADYFDFIIIDECHRGGANDEGNWRGILEYFAPAVQLGLTATPKRKDNVDTYKYFGEPVYI